MQGGFAKPAGQLKAIVLDEVAVAVKLVGPVGGTASQVAAARVAWLAWADGADAPYASADSTL